MMEIQQKLLGMYMQTKVVDKPTKGRMVQLCGNILQYMDRIDPDNEQSPKRVMVRRCLVETRLETLTKEYKEGRVDKTRLAEALKEKKLLISIGSTHMG